VGRKGSKKNGLIKKVIKLQIGGQEWGLVAYYTLDDAIKDRLARPRNTSLNARLVAWGLNPDFFAQPRKAARTAVMTDDDGQSPVRSCKCPSSNASPSSPVSSPPPLSKKKEKIGALLC